MPSVDELECGCCCELLCNPTTLTCGHSFCRYCLAKWFVTSNKPECPLCRQTWSGFPQVNITLRRVIDKSFPVKIVERQKSQENTADYHEVLQMFEEYGKNKDPDQVFSEEYIKTVIGAILLIIVAAVVILLIAILYWLFFTGDTHSNSIYSKPAYLWSVNEVETWAEAFSKQLGHDYSRHFQNLKIDGELLLSLNEEDLKTLPLNVTINLHRKLILAEINKLQATGIRTPRDLWEYKNANRISSVFLLFMLQEFPRLTLFCFRCFNYNHFFRPFMETVISEPQDCSSLSGYNIDNLCVEKEITLVDRWWFYLECLLLPFLPVAKFSYHFVKIHFYTVWMIIAHCTMLTVHEIVQFFNAEKSWNAALTTYTEAVFSFIIRSVMYKIATWFAPSFILDFYFITKLYYGPFETAHRVRLEYLRRSILRGLNVLVAAATLERSLRNLFNIRRGNHRR
ncbi:bifunctional apoptosis regulator-like [Xenia sp. Carnegie-2017]|uniref:bifunctional apoptosis regulator-like n=1 Tax=Xenia sp. Carnegie-2017 TaxID=2897299 RepID=UPI001F04E09F|nr:bifunctional apoptosis regulator-like [Xenia sp. Carnegie-2017]